MDQTLLLWLSVIIIVAFGTLAHFLYDLAHRDFFKSRRKHKK